LIKKPILNEDLLENRAAEFMQWDAENEGKRWFSLYRFMRFAVLSRLAPQVVEDPFVAQWKATAHRQTSHLLNLQPRGGTKSSQLKAFACFLICEHEAHVWGKQVRIAFCGQTGTFAKRTVTATRRALETNRFILTNYQNPKPDKDLIAKRKDFLVSIGIPEDADISKVEWTRNAFRTTFNIEGELESGVPLEEPTMWAQGFNEATTGRHFDVGMVDDPVGQKNFRSMAMKAVTRDVHYDLQSQLMDGLYIVLGTRWAQDDLHHTILDEHFDMFDCHVHDIWGGGKNWTKDDFEVVDSKPIFKHDLSEVTLYWDGYGLLEEESKQGFRFPPEERKQRAFDFIAKKMFTVSGPFWQKQYLNRATSEDDQLFQDWMFVTCPIPQKRFNTFVLTDSATGKDSRSSLRVVASVSLDEKDDAYLIDLEFGRWGPEEYCRKIINQSVRHGAIMVGMEAVAWQESFKTTMDLICRMDGNRTPLVADIHGRSEISKFERMEGMEPRMRLRKFFINEALKEKECGGVNVLKEMKQQFFRVQDAEHSQGLILDIVDALSDIDVLDKKGNRVFFPPKRLRGGSKTMRLEDSVMAPERQKQMEARQGGSLFKRGPKPGLQKPRKLDW